MTSPFIVMSRSRIKPGRADDYAKWCADMFRDVEESEPRLLAFNVFEAEDGMSVVIQVHPDPESFEYHLKLFAERVKETADYVDTELVEIYGQPSPFVEQFVTHGVPGMPIAVHPWHKAGFTRLGSR